MALEDIPVRDGEDGATQLALLRAYLKDRDSNSYRFADSYLIGSLEFHSKERIWKDLTSAPEDAIPWSYDLTNPTGHINIVRSMTDDTDPLQLKYTDYEILQYLEFLPLRYLVTSLNANVEDTSTYPNDPRNPIRVMRDLLDDEEGSEYSDHDLIQRMFDDKQNPYQVAISIIKCKGSMQASEDARQFGNELAAIDGISFGSTSGGSQSTSDDNLQIITREMENSVYAKESDYNWFVDGEPLATTQGDWYAI